MMKKIHAKAKLKLVSLFTTGSWSYVSHFLSELDSMRPFVQHRYKLERGVLLLGSLSIELCIANLIISRCFGLLLFRYVNLFTQK